jgi:hypothetical protein
MSMRSGASVSQLRAVRALPRGARTTRSEARVPKRESGLSMVFRRV